MPHKYPPEATVIHINGHEVFLNESEREALIHCLVRAILPGELAGHQIALRSRVLQATTVTAPPRNET